MRHLPCSLNRRRGRATDLQAKLASHHVGRASLLQSYAMTIRKSLCYLEEVTPSTSLDKLPCYEQYCVVNSFPSTNPLSRTRLWLAISAPFRMLLNITINCHQGAAEGFKTCGSWEILILYRHIADGLLTPIS